MRRSNALALFAIPLLLAACSKPEPPEKERPPEPKASEPRHTELLDAIQAPIDQAKSVEQTTLDAADQQRAQIDAQTGG